MRKVLCIITASIMIVTMLSGCSVLKKIGFGNNDELQPVSSVVMNEEDAQKLTDKMPISLYFATGDNSKLKLEVRYVDIKEAKKSVNSLANLIVKELIAGPKGADLKATIPQGTQQLGSVSIDAKVATVNFSKEFVDKHPGGEPAARMTIYSVVNSLTELNEIEKVKFLVNGKAMDDFKGAYKLSSAFPRTVALISTDVGNAAAASKTNETAKKDTTKSATPTPSGKATPTPQSNVKATPTPTPQGNIKTTPTPQGNEKAAPAATVTPKPTTAPKATATPTPKPSTGKTSSNTQSSADAEATYLEILE